MKCRLSVAPLVSLLFLILAACLTALAQDKPLPKTISGGILNVKADTLPKPEYPKDARLTRTGGTVRVQVLIDETGRVLSAKAVSGIEHVSLRQAAEAAALKATFSPTKLSGQPVKVSGVITYNFVANNYEEELKVLAISTFLTVARQFVHDLDKLDKIFEGENMFEEGVSEFPEFASEFSALTSLEKLPIDKRTTAIDNALSAINSKLTESERWQFEVGRNLGDITAPFMLMMVSGGEPDFSKVNEPVLKLNLNKIRNLTLSAPSDFPPDVLEKLKQFAAVAGRENLLSEEGIREFALKMTDLLETISPESTK